MAKNHIITRKGNTLNLNTNKGVKMENLYAGGSDIIAAGIGGATTGLGTYNKLANNYNTDIYDSTLGAVPQAVSIGNYDALADWKRSNPVLTNPTADDLDTMSTSGKIGAGLSTIGSMTATGAQTGSWLGGILGFGAGVGTVLAGLREGERKRERLAKDIAFKNSLAEQRLNSMYLHELGDIQEEQANQALANLEAKGGKIHIKPSKRGTFRAQAKRMGMSVQEAARHILANKNRYSPAMRKKAAFAKAAAGWKHEDGGPLFQFPVEYNHGGYFTLDPELVKIDQGGTHEQNPLDGVPMGFDENGIPNLVEEGETIFDDYVFSNRLAPTEKQLAEGGLATKYKNHTFADISAKIAKTFEETPTDFIARESFKESMQRLKTIQEQVKADKEAEEQINAATEQYLSPEEQTAYPKEQMPQEMAGVPEEMSQEEVPAGIEAYNNVPVDMMAFGGNLFVKGGDFEKVKGHNYIQRNKKTGEYTIDEDAINEAIERAEVAGYPISRESVIAQAQSQIDNIVAKETNSRLQNERKQKAKEFIQTKYGEKGLTDKGFGSKVSQEDRETFTKIMQGELDKDFNISSPSSKDTTQERKTDGAAGQAKREASSGSSRGGVNTALYKEGLTPEQKKEAWYNSSGKALKEIINKQADIWDKLGDDPNVESQRKEFAEALNSVQRAYALAYEAGYDPKTGRATNNAKVRELQELFNHFNGNRYFGDLMNVINPQGNSGDNSAKGWLDSIWGDITRNRNWGLSEYFADGEVPEDITDSIRRAKLTYTPTISYGNDGQKAYTFGLQSDRTPLEPLASNTEQQNNILNNERSGLAQTTAGTLLQAPEGELQRPDVTLTPEQEKLRDKMQRRLAGQESLPTWMRYAPIFGAGLGAIWNAAQKPDYSVAEAVERASRSVPRVRFNPIGNYLTYRPVDGNYYLNQVRNQGLTTDRGILNSSGANQGAATAGLLASQYNTQGAIGNSLMQQELANRQNEQQVAQFNRGTDQYNSQGLFNESVYNQRSGMQRAQMGITAAQLRQAERQRRNAAISADLTNLFQGIGDIGWENMNRNMTKIPGLYYGIDRNNVVSHIPNEVAVASPNIVEATYTGTPTPEQVEEQAKRAQRQNKYGGMLTKRKKSKSRR